MDEFSPNIVPALAAIGADSLDDTISDAVSV